MFSIDEYFADNYSVSRQNFLSVCKEKGLEVKKYVNDKTDNRNVELATELVLIGSVNAEKLLIITSGIHGAELMCGSGCQTGMLSEDTFAHLENDTAVILIHALNPWGAVNLRRNNEDNIDLCRNFVDFSKDLPVNEHYRDIHSGQIEDVQNKWRSFREDNGVASLASTLMSGQFDYENGFSFGGKQATWSNEILMSILHAYAQGARKVCVLDYHSGLGPYGYGSLVSLQSGTNLQRARNWFGPWVTAPMETTMSAGENFHPAIGHTTLGYERALPDTEVTSVVLEYGTYDMNSNLQALLDDHCLFLQDRVTEEEKHSVKKAMLKAHYPDDSEWRYAVWTRSVQVVRQALKGLKNE